MKTVILFLIVMIAFCAWCPWLDLPTATTLIETKAKDIKQGATSNCVLTVDQNSINRIMFGYSGIVSYSCSVDGVLVSQGKNPVFVSFFEWVFNMPDPIIK